MSNIKQLYSLLENQADELSQALAEMPPVPGGYRLAIDDVRTAKNLLRSALSKIDFIGVPDLPTNNESFSVAAFERRAIRRALRAARGNKREAARLLRIGKTTLYRKLNDYDITY